MGRKKCIRLALIGYGNVAKAFAWMLDQQKSYIEKEFDCNVEITAVSTKRSGSVIEPGGICMGDFDLSAADERITALDVIDHADYDVMMELTPLNIQSGQPAIDHVRHALQRGKHVITANKGPIAWAYRELNALAEENHVLFYHEATVLDGAPVYNMTQETLKGCEILEIKGIFNVTTNYLLGEMERGIPYEEAIREGQRRGFVEADPSMDLEGWDAAAKLAALMNVLMKADITPMDIVREGIGSITKEQIDCAEESGQKIKVLCHGRLEDGVPVGTVKPQLVNSDSLYATINKTASVVTLHTDLMGEITVIEGVHEPKIDQTAYGVLSDFLRILTKIM